MGLGQVEWRRLGGGGGGAVKKSPLSWVLRNPSVTSDCSSLI